MIEDDDVEVEPQSDEKVAEVQLSAPDSTDVVTDMGAEGSTDDHTMDVFFGEQVVSIRELLKRYCLHSGVFTGVYANEDRGWTMDLTQPDFPFYKGWCPDGPHMSTSGPFAYSHMTFLNYFAPCFVAYRGGIRWKYLATRNPISTGNTDASSTTQADVFGSVTRDDGLTKNLSGDQVYTPYSYSSVVSIFRSTVLSGFNNAFGRTLVTSCQSEVTGAHVAPIEMNPSLEVELPFYTNRRFFNARRINVVDTRQADIGRPIGGNHENPPVHKLQITGNKCAVLGYVAAADDFSLSFFTGVPIMYSQGGDSTYGFPPADIS